MTDVLSRNVDVADSLWHFHTPLTGRCTDDKIIEQHRSIDRTFFDRIEMKHIGLHTLAQCFHIHRCRPCALSRPIRLLQAQGLLGEIGQGNFDQLVVRLCSHTIPCGRDDANQSTLGFRLWIKQGQQHPVARLGGFIFFQAQLHQLPIFHG